MNVIHNGTVVMISAAIDDGTVCSAQVTPPFPPASISPPSSAAFRQCSARSTLMPRKAHHPSTPRPATRKRVPAIVNGGMVSIPIAIAR